MPRDHPRQMSSAPTKKMDTGIAFCSFQRNETGTNFRENPSAAIIGSVPAPNATI